MAIIDKCLIEQFGSKLEQFTYVLSFAIFVLRVIVAADLVEMDEDLLQRFKFTPILGFLGYLLSKRIRHNDIHPRYRVIVFPFYLVASTEMLLKTQYLTQLMVFSLSQQFMGLIMKVSQLNRVEKLALIILKGVYVSGRYYLEFRHLEEPLLLKALVPLIGQIFANFISIEMDEEISKLLNTRFLKSQQMWFQSLRHMPIGVLIYDVEAGSIVFENR